MTYEEAIFILHPETCAQALDGTDNQFDAIDVIDKASLLACEALEKQIPKKPKRLDHWFLCPTCYDKYGFSYDILVGMRGLKTGECHCLNCGQAIDWSETE